MAVWSAVVSTAIPFVLVALVLLLTWQLSRCAVPLTSTNRLYKDKRERISLAGWAWHDANDLSSSPWFGSKGAQVLLGYRCFLLLTFFLVVVLELTAGDSTADWATFFTNWTFVGLAVHSIVGIAQSVRGINRCAQRPESAEWIWQPFDWFDQVHSIIAVSIITISLHVAIFYWAALYPGSIKADGAFKHGVNALLLQIELWISSFPWTSSWVVFPCAYILIYAVYMWIWHAADDSWVYDSLDYEESSAPAMYLGVSVLVLFAFAICWLGAWVREKSAAKCFTPSAVERALGADKPEQHTEVQIGALPQ